VGDLVSVAIPIRNGRRYLDDTLSAIRTQQLDRPIEVIVADSGSTDGSREIARRQGAMIIDVEPERFSHGGTRNLLWSHASGTHIAFLTQDAVPSTSRWLATLLDGFGVASDVALVFGPYLPRAGASWMVRRELDEWFLSLSPDGAPTVDRGLDTGTGLKALRRMFFTDANACIARAALERVPFREVAYAEDQLLAREMLAAGYAKVYRPDAPVIHSHEYSTIDVFRRSFDEWRGLREVHGVTAAPGPAGSALAIQRNVRDDLGFMRRQGIWGWQLLRGACSSAAYQSARATGAMLGARANCLPPSVREVCSLERRRDFDADTLSAWSR
jgi:glycosyltransferase involved in cell wall biosynthesis